MTDPPDISPGAGTAKVDPSFLVITQGLKAGLLFVLERSAAVIGRADDVDIVVPDRGVSTVHAIVRLDPDGVASIQDLRSTNGTRVNGRRILTALALQDGDEISIGAGTTLTFTRDAATAERLARLRASK